MRSLKCSFAVLPILLISFQCLSQIQRAGTPLPTALATGQAKATIRGTGASSGDSIKVTLLKGPNAAAEPLEISIPAGTILKNGNGAGQDMVVGEVLGRVAGESSYEPTSNIVLTGNEAVTYILSAYCVNFEKDNPSEADLFSVMKPDPVLGCILKNSSGLSVEARQAAVWIYSDNVSHAHMSEKFPVSSREFSQGRQVVDQCRKQQP
jgi:hypothetical protein